MSDQTLDHFMSEMKTFLEQHGNSYRMVLDDDLVRLEQTTSEPSADAKGPMNIEIEPNSRVVNLDENGWSTHLPEDGFLVVHWCDGAQPDEEHLQQCDDIVDALAYVKSLIAPN